MDNKHDKKVISLLTKEEFMRSNALTNIVVYELGLASEGTHKKRMKEMVRKKIIFKVVLGKQEVWYCIKSKIAKDMRGLRKLFEGRKSKIITLLDSFKRSYSKLSLEEKAEQIVILDRMLNMLAFKTEVVVYHILKKSGLVAYHNTIDAIRTDIENLVIANEKDNGAAEVFTEADSLLDKEYRQLEDAIDDRNWPR